MFKGKDVYKRQVFDRYGVTWAVLFGSIAKGTATPKSDLDLLVQSDLKGLKFVGLIEACLLYTSRCV